MLNGVKAISFGIISIMILGLVSQLILIMSLVGYGSLSKIYPALLPWSQIFTYALGGLGYFITLLFGGLITAMAAVNHSYPKAIAASILGSSFSLYWSLKDEFFTPIALFFIVFGIISSIFGCWLWHHYQSGERR